MYFNGKFHTDTEINEVIILPYTSIQIDIFIVDWFFDRITHKMDLVCAKLYKSSIQ